MRKVFFALVLSIVLLPVQAVGAGLEPPEPVSPGSLIREVTVAEPCPTFSWSAVVGSAGYGLVVYEVTGEGELGGAVIEQRLSAGVSSWTPPLNQALSFGRRYAWTVGAITRKSETLWSEPAFFKVAPGPSAAELRQALRIVRSYLGSQGAAVPEVSPEERGESVEMRGPVDVESPSPLAPPPGTQMSVVGNLDATSFSGSGALLTSLDPANLAAGTATIDISGTAATASDVVGAACISESELDFDPATQAEMTSGIATHSSEVAAHHVLPTELPPSGVAGGDLTGTFPSPGVIDAIARDSEVTAGVSAHAGVGDAHREHATLEESAEIDSDIGVHAALPSVHHTPTADTDTVLTEAQVESFVTDGPLDMANNPITNIGAVGTDFTATGGLTLSGDLRVDGNVGIGTSDPAVRLEVSGGNVLIDGGSLRRVSQDGGNKVEYQVGYGLSFSESYTEVVVTGVNPGDSASLFEVSRINGNGSGSGVSYGKQVWVVSSEGSSSTLPSTIVELPGEYDEATSDLLTFTGEEGPLFRIRFYKKFSWCNSHGQIVILGGGAQNAVFTKSEY